MVIGGLSYSELSEILKNNGYFVESDEFWHQHNRIMLKRANEPVVVLQFKEHYTFAFIVKFLNSLGIQPPEECQKHYDWFAEKMKNYTDNSKETDKE